RSGRATEVYLIRGSARHSSKSRYRGTSDILHALGEIILLLKKYKDTNLMTKFTPGLLLSEMFFKEIIEKNLKIDFPHLKYSAGLIGAGSEVLGFDTPLSADHDWGPRIILFLSPKDYKNKKIILDKLTKKLPKMFKGYPTTFGRGNKKSHGIDIYTLKSYFEEYLGLNPLKMNHLDWLILSEHRLRTITSGKMFLDDLNVKKIQQKLLYYPKDIWFYLLAAEWQKIGQEEHLAGRCGILKDEIGSQIIATRLVRNIMSLCFLMEKTYAPYSKWFGTAFMKLTCTKKMNPLLKNILSAKTWKVREKYLSLAFTELAEMHNNLKITKPLATKVSTFFTRPYLIISGSKFADEILKNVKNKAIKKTRIGSVNQFLDSVDVLDYNDRIKKLKVLYQ
ncbi:MAG: hypothetical protein UT32_C0050G0001, partial [Parcubacteria group bacterium GW2011_GWC2_39_14]